MSSAPERAGGLQVTGTVALAPAEDVPLLPAEERLIDEAVDWLNGAVRRSGLDLAVVVHRYLLDRFFGGRYEAFADPSRTKPTSFRALCASPRLALSANSLYTMVRVGEQLAELPEELGRTLSVGHHRALLPVTDPVVKRDLAARAAAARWSVRELEDAIRLQRPPSRAGRPRLSPVVRASRAIVRGLGALPAPDDLAGALTPAEREEVAAALVGIERAAEVLRAALARV